MSSFTSKGVLRVVVRYTTFCSAAFCAAFLLVGCGSSSPELTESNAASPSAPTVGGGSSATSPAGSRSPAASGKNACQYLTVDQVKNALKYAGTLQAGPGPTSSPTDSTCEYARPGDDDIPATLDIMRDPRLYNFIKATWSTTGCKSAGIGDESIYCPDQEINPKPQVMFTKGGVVVLVTVTDPKVADWKAGDPVDAGLALGNIVAGEL
jgi:hypothetical protein